METFKDYAYYYNLFYGDKDYRKEAEQVDCMIKHYTKKEVKTILNMGCGTGKHDFELCDLGYKMTGIDLSDEMIEIAKENSKKSKCKPNFQVADVRTYETEKKFDTVISLFHVMSYQNENEDIVQAIETAGKALELGGLFIFDVWYGPGVLTERPEIRIKQVEDEKNTVIRYAKPVMHAEKNLVDVNYDVIIIDKKTAVASKIFETHHMRYFFAPEIRYILEKAGFSLLDCLDCNTMKKTDYNSWTAFFIAIKNREIN